MYDIISIGDSTVDIFLELDEANVKCDLDREACELCINYADKIPVKRMTRINAVGNAANNAVGSSRLGKKAAIFTIVGDDDTGRGIVQQLKKERVATGFISVDKGRGSNYSTVINYKGERTILVYHEHRDYRWRALPRSQWIYFTSMGEGSEQIFSDLVAHVKRMKPRLAFNPGTFQLKLGLAAVKPILEMTDVLFVNKEEAKRLLGEEEGESNHLPALLTALHAHGVKIVVITDGEKGAYAFDGTAMYFCDIFDAPVVERTGCGDAFASGFLGALAYGLDVKEAMRWGSVNSAGVLQYIGAQEGLQTKEKILSQLAMHPEYQPKPLTTVASKRLTT